MTVLINGVEYVPRKKLNSIKPPGTFGQAIRAMRKQQKLSLNAAAVAIGCSKSYLWALEHDASEPSLRMRGILQTNMEHRWQHLPLAWEKNRACESMPIMWWFLQKVWMRAQGQHRTVQAFPRRHDKQVKRGMSVLPH